MPAQTVIKVRRDSFSNWTAVGADPVLAAGEISYDTTNKKFKVGDGTAVWSALPYTKMSWDDVTGKPTEFTPADHAATHATGGGDAITIGQSQVTDLTTDLAAKATNPMTAVGDLIVGGTVTSGVAAPARLAKGTDGQVLSLASGTPAWTDPAGGLPTQGTDTAGEMLVSGGTGGATWSNTVTANSASVPAIIAKGTTSQSEPVQEWRNSGETKAAFVSANGQFNARSSITLGFDNTTSGSKTLAFYSNGNSPTTTSARITADGGTSTENAGTLAITATGGVSVNGPLTANPATPTAANSAKAVGFIGMPQNAPTITGNYTYTFGLADAGEHFYATGTPTSATLTIPANGIGGGQVAFEIGTTIVIINDFGAATNLSIAINTDTLVLAGTGATGTRTLARYGMATLVKVTATRWIISGNGLT